MNTNQIYDYLTDFKYGKLNEKFIGVFPRDCLPEKVKQYPAALIANTDPKTERGEHWIAIYIDQDGRGRYFDSYGLPPLHADFTNFLQRNCSSWKYNRDHIQGATSISCGKFYILYLCLKSMNWHHNKIISLFNKNDLEQNDELVKEYVSLLKK